MYTKSDSGGKFPKTMNKTVKELMKPALNPLPCSEPTGKTNHFFSDNLLLQKTFRTHFCLK